MMSNDQTLWEGGPEKTNKAADTFDRRDTGWH